MKNKKLVVSLVIIIAMCSAACAWIGITSNDGGGQYSYTSVHGQEVTIYGTGIYKNESLSMASQVIAQDYIILILAIPALLVSMVAAFRSSKGLMALAGTLGFFLYTYTSYSFTAMYNHLFLVYILLMSCSLAAFILVCSNAAGYGLRNCFFENPKLKFSGTFMIAMAALVGSMWLGRILPPLFSGTVPETVEHYTTLIIQAMDIGIVIPAMIIGGILTFRKNPLGYFLVTLMSIKTLTLLISITAMMIGMSNNGVPASSTEIISFGTFNLIAIINIVFILKSIKQPSHYVRLSGA